MPTDGGDDLGVPGADGAVAQLDARTPAHKLGTLELALDAKTKSATGGASTRNVVVGDEFEFCDRAHVAEATDAACSEANGGPDADCPGWAVANCRASTGSFKLPQSSDATRRLQNCRARIGACALPQSGSLS